MGSYKKIELSLEMGLIDTAPLRERSHYLRFWHIIFSYEVHSQVKKLDCTCTMLLTLYAMLRSATLLKLDILLTHLCPVDCSILIKWTSPFMNKGMSGSVYLYLF